MSDRHPQPRAFGAELPQRREDQVVQPAPGDAHPEQPGPAGADLPDRGVDLGRLGQDPPRAGDQFLTGRGEPQRLGGAIHQACAQPALQQPDLLTEGRLGDVEPARGGGEVALLGQRDEVAQQAQVHGIPP